MSSSSRWRNIQLPKVWIDPSQAHPVAMRNLLVSLSLFIVWWLNSVVPQGIAPYAYITPAFAVALLVSSCLLLWRPHWVTVIGCVLHALANCFVLSTIYRSLYHPPDNPIYAVAFLSSSTIYVLVLQVMTFATFQQGAKLFGWIQYSLVVLLVLAHWLVDQGTAHPGTVTPRVVLMVAPLVSMISLGFLVRWRNDATREALVMQHEKEKLMAMVSHEIRGQLQTTLSTGELLSTKVFDPVAKRALLRLTRVTLQLDRYLRDWVEFVRLENPELGIEEKTFNLVELVDQTVDEHQVAFLDKGLVLSGPLWSALDETTMQRWQTAQGDPVRLKQVLSNLIDNALKYTSAGCVSVRVSALTEHAHHWARVDVTDTGPGIDPAQLQLVFQPFMRLSTKGMASIEGSGLGLAIASRLMQRMGGQLQASSQPGAGANFTMSLPLKPRPGQKR